MIMNDYRKINNISGDMVASAMIHQWAQEQVEKGGTAYVFDETKVPDKFKKDLEFISGKPYSAFEKSLANAIDEAKKQALKKEQKQEKCVTDTLWEGHDIRNIIAGTVFRNLDILRQDFTKFPAALASCKVEEDFVCAYCHNLVDFKNSPKAKVIYCIGNSSLESLEGCYEGVKSIYIDRCYNLKYISPQIPDCIIKGLPTEKIAECKANWEKEHQEKPLLSKIREAVISAFTHSR